MIAAMFSVIILFILMMMCGNCVLLQIFTFDEYGVSGHANHCSVYHGVQ